MNVSIKTNIAGTEVGITWIHDSDIEKYQPCRQVYGISFNENKEILIIKGPDSDKIAKGEIVYPQRFMCGNPNTTEKDIDAMIEYVRELGQKATKEISQ